MVSLRAKGKYEYWLTSEGLLRIGGWARDGLTDEQIAKNMGISRSTLNEWAKKYPDISDTLKKSKDVADREVENSLFKRATGYEYDEVKEKYEGGILTERTVTKKMVVPDTAAQIFWLKNRKPSVWRDKAQVDTDAEFSKVDELIAAIDKAAKS